VIRSTEEEFDGLWEALVLILVGIVPVHVAERGHLEKGVCGSYNNLLNSL
jgi:hypothetical protein